MGRSSTADLNAGQMADWQRRARELGASAEEWDQWIEHQAAHAHLPALIGPFEWLRKAGFETIDCTWRYILWTVVQARKGA